MTKVVTLICIGAELLWGILLAMNFLFWRIHFFVTADQHTHLLVNAVLSTTAGLAAVRHRLCCLCIRPWGPLPAGPLDCRTWRGLGAVFGALILLIFIAAGARMGICISDSLLMKALLQHTLCLRRAG